MNGFETLLKLCGYIVIFSILCKPLSLLKNSIPFVSLLFGSILEVTNGISCIAGYGFSKEAMFLLCTTCTSFGGICGIAQTSSMISDTNLSMSVYIRDKLFFFRYDVRMCSLLPLSIIMITASTVTDLHLHRFPATPLWTVLPAALLLPLFAVFNLFRNKLCTVSCNNI